MSKITRITAVPFGFTGTTDDFETFGSTAVGSTDYSKDIAAIQATAAWQSGWRPALIAAKAPVLQDMNAKMLVDSYMITYLMQAGIAEYDSATTYYTGSLCTNPGTSQIFASLVDSNVGNALPTAPASNGNWQFIGGMIGTNYVDSRVTAWQNEGSVSFGGFGSVGGPSVQYRRVGDSMECVFFFKSGVPVASTASITIPEGKSADTTKFPGNNNNMAGVFNCSRTAAGPAFATAQSSGVLFVNSADPTKILMAVNTATVAAAVTYVTANGNDIAVTSSCLSGRFTVPIVGWA